MDKAEIMERILDVRYTDLEEERKLCKQLLETAEPEMDTYSCAFANVYLVDCSLALGEYDNCGFYLVRATYLCREHGYEDLLLNLCNFAGLYYLKLNDEQTTLDYYIEGLQLARKMEHFDLESKLLNNIGICFGGRGDWVTAKVYFGQAVEVIRLHMKDTSVGNVISYLSNLAEACHMTGDLDGSRNSLLQCEELHVEGLYQQIRLACAWSSYYASLNDVEKCRELNEQILQLGLLDFEQKYFVCDMSLGQLDCMLEIGDAERAEFFMNVLEELQPQTPILSKFSIQCLKIKYLEEYGDEQRLNQAYQEYYDIFKEIKMLEDQASSQSLISKLQLTNAIIERESMKSKNKELENEGKLDELTGLYNRRYYNKLVSKAAADKKVHTWGLIMLDLDYFKQYNDFYGHFAGDGALRAVSDCLSQWAAEGIYPCRYGGDEFVCLCLNLPDEEVENYVQNVTKTLKKRNIPHEKSMLEGEKRLSLSIGYCNENSDVGYETLMALADQALYEVKKAGRDGISRKKAGCELQAKENDGML